MFSPIDIVVLLRSDEELGLLGDSPNVFIIMIFYKGLRRAFYDL